MSKVKELNSPGATGGKGPHFEALVQASFVTLMLTGGYAPGLPRWPIVKIALQNKIRGFDTDDLMVICENTNKTERRKLLCEVKSSIEVTEGSDELGKVMGAAWNDFNKPDFVKNKDAIALITGPLSAVDQKVVAWLLNQARCGVGVDEFFQRVQRAKFSPSKSNEKLQAIQHHLDAANGKEVPKGELHKFLRHFHWLCYDFDSDDSSVILSLLLSLISQFQPQHADGVWGHIVNTVEQRNKNAGSLTLDNLPEDLREKFIKPKPGREMPEKLKEQPRTSKTNWDEDPSATYLALAVLVGAWDDNAEEDNEVISILLGTGHDTWRQNVQAMRHRPESPLSSKNGVVEVVDRAGLWNTLNPRILDRNLDNFRTLAIKVLEEPDPAFELPANERYTARFRGKRLKYSDALRRGIAEGLAILGSSQCSPRKAESTSVLAIREIFAGANWVRWASLNDLLPILAEAAPKEFLGAVEEALRLTPCPFDELFAQEGEIITGTNYLTGLLWALEGLAWDKQYLVRVCVALGKLAGRDPGGRWSNRPFNSLVTILLPWHPQTLAPPEKRKVAVETLLGEQPDIGWKLLIQLLHNQHRVSFESYKPKWRKTIPDDWKKGTTHQKYWQQVSSYEKLAVEAAPPDAARLSMLIEHFDKLQESAFDQLVNVLDSPTISGLPEDQKLSIWNSLTKFTTRHRRFASSGWALPDESITRIENVSEKFAPKELFNLYQYLFNNSDFALYDDESDDWKQQQLKLDERRETAVREIFQQQGLKGVIKFAESVVSAHRVGHALGIMADEVIEQSLLPQFLDTVDSKHKDLVSGFIWRRNYNNGWQWCDSIDKSEWTPSQVGQFLAYLPFTEEAWDRVDQWLEKNQGEYWSRTPARQHPDAADLAPAVKRLIEHDRPYAALNCLHWMCYRNQPINVDQCVRALLAVPSSKELMYEQYDPYLIVKLIKFLQSEPSVSQEDLCKIEWKHLPLLYLDEDTGPRFLGSRLANDPEFFCEAIWSIYRSKKEEQPPKEVSQEAKAIAENAFRLLENWETPPGVQEDGAFKAEEFKEWIQRVTTLCTESGHLEVALGHIGEVLLHAPADPDGLWIHRTVASALNEADAEEMRAGFWRGKFNSRGAHWVDPHWQTGKRTGQGV